MRPTVRSTSAIRSSMVMLPHHTIPARQLSPS